MDIGKIANKWWAEVLLLSFSLPPKFIKATMHTNTPPKTRRSRFISFGGGMQGELHKTLSGRIANKSSYTALLRKSTTRWIPWVGWWGDRIENCAYVNFLWGWCWFGKSSCWWRSEGIMWFPHVLEYKPENPTTTTYCGQSIFRLSDRLLTLRAWIQHRTSPSNMQDWEM